MILAGELIIEAPNRPGFWAYRQLPDGSLLEIQLTSNEWHQVREQWLAKANVQIDQLNQHPLNVAARDLILRSGEHPTAPGSFHWLNILLLGSLTLSRI